MPQSKQLRNENHHWWPEALSRFWADSSGHVRCMMNDGVQTRSLPKSFGTIRNDNTIRFADEPTPWDESFEDAFDTADTGFPSLIAWLQTLSSPIPAADEPLRQRLTPLTPAKEQHALLAECVASLIVRSPGFRNRVRATIERFRGELGIADPAADKNLIGINVRHGQRVLADAMARSGKFSVLLSGTGEFLFGDGFMHNIYSVANPPHLPRCLVPLTPEIAVFYTRPMSYSAHPAAFVMNLLEGEVSLVNKTVQIYSRRFLFFRNAPPGIEPEFSRGEHRQIKHDEHPWTAGLEQAMIG